MRTFDEIESDVYNAAQINDVDVLARCAAELEEHSTPEAEALRLRTGGKVHLLHGDRETAMEHYERALEYYVDVNDTDRAAIVISNLSLVYASVGDYTVALEYCHRAIGNYEIADNQDGIARVTLNIGAMLANIGDYPSALEHFHRALASHKAAGYMSGVANAMGNMGAVYTNIGSQEEALEHFRNAASIYEQLGDTTGLAHNFLNIGSVYFNLSQFPAALEFYQKARALQEDHRLAINHGLLICNIGRTLLAMGSIGDAQTQLDTLDAMYLADRTEEVEREHLRAKIQEANGQLDEAVATLKRALVDTVEHNLRGQAAELHESLRDLALQRNDLAGYVEHNNAFTRITEEVKGKDAAMKIAVQQKQREIEVREREHEKQLAVLHSTLPKQIADRVARGEQVNDHYDNAAVIFLDIVGFTTMSAQLSSAEVIELLDEVFTALDAACKKHDVVKIKTIGDSYMAASFPSQVSDSEQQASHVVERAARATIEMLESVSHVVSPTGSPLQVRLGMHVGPVTAGVLGRERLQYDVWGDTVNVASRMESHGEPGRIHVSEAFALALGSRLRGNDDIVSGNDDIDSGNDDSSRRPREGGDLSPHPPIPLSVRSRGSLDIKGKGPMTTYWLERA